MENRDIGQPEKLISQKKKQIINWEKGMGGCQVKKSKDKQSKKRHSQSVRNQLEKKFGCQLEKSIVGCQVGKKIELLIK